LEEVVVSSKKESSSNSWWHSALDVIGIIDPFGIADGINAISYLIEGDYKNAALSAISIIPFADGVKALKYADEAAQVIENVVKYEDEVQEIVQKTARGKSSKQLRKEWQEAEGKSWPKEPGDATKNQHAHHKEPLADGGKDGYSNIQPLPAKDRRQLHKDRGDHKRWGARAKPKKG